MAFFKGSYYQNLAVFDPPEDGARNPGFKGVRARAIANPEPVLEHTVAAGDRLDALGQNYYANPRDWRRLADCNPDAMFPEDLILREADTRTRPPTQAGNNVEERLGEVLLVPRRRQGQA